MSLVNADTLLHACILSRPVTPFTALQDTTYNIQERGTEEEEQEAEKSE